MYISTNYF